MGRQLTQPLAGSVCVVLATTLLGACASLQEFVEPPGVRLQHVELKDLDLERQTFVLSFDVSNPNAFALPIKTISYGVELDGHRFASGETESGFTVPARGDGEFAISVDLNLLRTAPELLFIVREGVERDIPYRIEGRLGVDIPLAKPVDFRNDGLIQLQSSLF